MEQPEKLASMESKKTKSKQDLIAWGVSVLFIITWLGCMWAWGIAEGWNAQSGYYYESVNDTQERFLPEPFGCNDTLAPGRDSGECTTTWYFWKIPPGEATTLSRAMVWLFYCLHQIFVWGLIYRAQLVMTFRKKGTMKYEKVGSAFWIGERLKITTVTMVFENYFCPPLFATVTFPTLYHKCPTTFSRTKLRWFNWSLLIVNAIFHILHLVQTHWTYDGTAQDVAISSSQASVIMMICFILLMEYKDRGFMLMWPNPRSDDKFAKYLRLHPAPIELIRKYHGIAFSWASIYTFWYHPMENTWGHTTGFFHTAIVLLQGSLIYTDMHLNRYWRLLNEAWVLLHGTLVAVQTSDPVKAGGSSAWPIFAFGFGLVFAFTQVYGLPFWKKISPFFRIIPILIFLGTVLALCGTVVEGLEPGQTGFSRMYEMFFIAGEEYMMLLFSWLFIYIILQIETVCNKSIPQQIHDEASATKQAFYVGLVVLIYALLMVISYLARNLTFSLIGMMIIFVFIFSIGVSVTLLLFKQLMGPFRKMAHGCKSARVKTKGDENENVSAVNQAYVTEL